MEVNDSKLFFSGLFMEVCLLVFYKPIDIFVLIFSHYGKSSFMNVMSIYNIMSMLYYSAFNFSRVRHIFVKLKIITLIN